MESAGDCEKIRMKRLFKRVTALASAAALTLSLAACGGSAVSGPKNTAPTNAKPVTITVWSYYNGDQLETFSKLVDEFNATVGKEQNITVEASSQGSVNDLETNVLAAAEGKVGAAEMPNIFSAYADTCYAVDQMGLVATAGKYYDWTDARTEVPDDGKALFGRDAMANYMLIGAKELGNTIFTVENGKMTVNLTEDAARKLWENYYVPFVKGWFAGEGRFRSDDIKTGNVLAYVGSNSSATFFPKQVQVSDTESHDISLKVLPNPSFAGSEEVAVQQGAGMVVTKSTPEEEAACVTFLKWFTQPENNIQFAVGSGYLPVTHAADDMTAIENSGLDLTDSMKDVLANAIDAVENHELYTPKPFAGGTDARKVLEYSMSDLASADRAAVEEQIAAGVSAAEAEALYLTDEYFENWYQSLCTKLSAYEG